MPYHKALESDNHIAKQAIERMDPRTGAVVPSNLVHGHSTRAGLDNVDADKESLIVGHSAGYHGAQEVIF